MPCNILILPSEKNSAVSVAIFSAHGLSKEEIIGQCIVCYAANSCAVACKSSPEVYSHFPLVTRSVFNHDGDWGILRVAYTYAFFMIGGCADNHQRSSLPMGV